MFSLILYNQINNMETIKTIFIYPEIKLNQRDKRLKPNSRPPTIQKLWFKKK